MSSWLQRHRLLAFYALAVAIVALVMLVRSRVDANEMLPALWAFQTEHGLYINLVTLGRFALEDPRAWLIFLFAGAPTLSALIVSFAADGSRGLRELLARFRLHGPSVSRSRAMRAYGLLLAGYVAGIALYLVLGSQRGAEGWADRVLVSVGGSLPAACFWLAVGPLIDEGGTLEELGWRGYAQPLLVDRLSSPLRGTLALGFLWWLWHFPREIPNILASDDLGRWAGFQALFLLLCLALSVIITFFWFRTGGSVWPAVLVHGGTNVWSKALGSPLFEALGDLRTWLVVGLAVLLLAVTRGRLGAPDAGA